MYRFWSQRFLHVEYGLSICETAHHRSGQILSRKAGNLSYFECSYDILWMLGSYPTLVSNNILFRSKHKGLEIFLSLKEIVEIIKYFFKNKTSIIQIYCVFFSLQASWRYSKQSYFCVQWKTTGRIPWSHLFANRRLAKISELNPSRRKKDFIVISSWQHNLSVVCEVYLKNYSQK